MAIRFKPEVGECTIFQYSGPKYIIKSVKTEEDFREAVAKGYSVFAHGLEPAEESESTEELPGQEPGTYAEFEAAAKREFSASIHKRSSDTSGVNAEGNKDKNSPTTGFDYSI